MTVTQEDLNLTVTQEDLNLTVKQEDLNLSLTQEDLNLRVTQEDLNLTVTQEDLNLTVTQEDLNLTVTQEDLNTWKTETLHGKYSNCLQENHVDKKYFLSWLSVDNAEREGFCSRLPRPDDQNQKLPRMSVEVVDRCRRCAKQ